MAQLKSYSTLFAFKQMLLSNNFVDLPDNPTREEAGVFYDLFSECIHAFKTSLVDDFKTCGIEELSFTGENFIPEDVDDQGLAVIYLYFSICHEKSEITAIAKYLIFQDAIKVYLSDSKRSMNDYSQNKLISNLIKNMANNIQGNFFELAQ